MKKLTKELFIFKRPNPMNLQRYRDIGDWIIDDGKRGVTFTIFTGDMKNTDYNFLVMLHEEIEAYLCYRRGIPESEVTAFDKAHGEVASPGDLPEAPYHDEHQVATEIEAIMSAQLDLSWPEYEKAITKTLKEYKKK